MLYKLLTLKNPAALQSYVLTNGKKILGRKYLSMDDFAYVNAMISRNIIGKMLHTSSHCLS